MSEEPQNLKEISTRWSEVRDVNRFVLRYTPAMQKYLTVILQDEDTAQDVLQSFLVRIIQKGFRDSIPDSGRFRDYLTRSVRNAAINQIRSKKMAQAGEIMLQQIESKWKTNDENWRRSWTECLVQRAWDAMEAQDYEAKTKTHFYAILRHATDHPKQTSDDAAVAVSSSLEVSLNAAAYRQQLSRARKQFAEFLVAEVRATLEDPTPEMLQNEIAELGLLPFVGKTLAD